MYNDGSKDFSSKKIDEIQNKYSQIKVFHNTNKGHGPTILQGYLESINESQWLFQVDSDNEMKASYFPSLWNQKENYDFLIGKRTNRFSPLSRKLISLISRLTVSSLYGTGVWDMNSPYRLMRSVFFINFIYKIPKNTFAPNLIVSGMACLNKARILELSVPHQERETGEVSIKKWKLFKAAMKSFLQTLQFRINLFKH